MTAVTPAQLDSYFKAIIDDYVAFQRRCQAARGEEANAAYYDRSIDEFKSRLKAKVGKKYIKVVREGYGVHSFIVLEDGDKFKRGDILKAASYAAPALNFPRGNVVAGLYASVTWTSP